MESDIQNEPQKYKVFHNKRVLELVQKNNNEKKERNIFDLKESLSFLKAEGGEGRLKLSCINLKENFEAFSAQFSIVEAAGGLVVNDEGKLLVIKRNGIWDLPKGKVEKGEKINEAAVREVQEECGIQKLKLGDLIEVTYHIYFKKKWVLKPTYWYAMHCADEIPTPQEEEGITEVSWMKKNDIEKIKSLSFPSLTPVFTRFLTIS